jgi:UDP-N-acetylmuramate: L-alanyl-gamma-D-glutamyl-meso-diaminopimelate ligase
MSTLLAELGIPFQEGYRAENLEPRPDLVIVGNKVSRGNPEVEALLASALPYISMPEALDQFFLRQRRSLVIAGTHGKTTSTSMLAWVLESAGRDPSLMVGGESLDFHGNFKLGRGGDFVIEGDEYDSAFFDKGPKFLHYRPDALLLTAVEFDHADIYRDLDAVKNAFARLIDITPKSAPLIVGGDFLHALDVVEKAGRQPQSFGTGACDWTVGGLRDTGESTQFEVRRHGRSEGEVAIRAPGAINACNALGVYALAREIGLSHDEIAAGLRSFTGVARRQEVVGEFGGVTVIDDFAHHPTAVAGTIAAIRGRYPRRRLWAVFEPRSNTSRRKIFQRDYVSAFRAADRVVIGAVFEKQTDTVAVADLFSPAQLVADLRADGVRAETPSANDEISPLLARDTIPGDVVVLMSNGSFGGLREQLVSVLCRSASSRSS